jgi:hypothetical protein
MVNALAWAKSHQPEAALGVAGVLIGVIALRKKTSSSTSSTPLASSTVDTSGTDLYTQLENQLTSLQNPASAPTGTGYVIPSGLVEQGDGYVVPGSAGLVEQDANGNTYTYIRTAAEAKAARESGEQVFFQPTPGQFAPSKGKKLAKGTPQFVRIP